MAGVPGVAEPSTSHWTSKSRTQPGWCRRQGLCWQGSPDVQSIIPRGSANLHLPTWSSSSQGLSSVFHQDISTRTKSPFPISKLDKREECIYHPRPNPEVKLQKTWWALLPSTVCSPPSDKTWVRASPLHPQFIFPTAASLPCPGNPSRGDLFGKSHLGPRSRDPPVPNKPGKSPTGSMEGPWVPFGSGTHRPGQGFRCPNQVFFLSWKK